MLSNTLVAFLCTILLQLISGYRNCKDIADSKLAHVDEEWFRESLENGMYKIEQGNWNHCLDKKSWKWNKIIGYARSVKGELCSTWEMNIPSGNVEVPMHCKYTRIENLECDIDFSNTPVHGNVEWSAALHLLHTDNSTYVAGTMCLFGKKSFYFIMTTTEAQLSPAVVASLGKKFRGIGFISGQTSARKGITELYFSKVKGHECN